MADHPDNEFTEDDLIQMRDGAQDVLRGLVHRAASFGIEVTVDSMPIQQIGSKTLQNHHTINLIKRL